MDDSECMVATYISHQCYIMKAVPQMEPIYIENSGAVIFECPNSDV